MKTDTDFTEREDAVCFDRWKQPEAVITADQALSQGREVSLKMARHARLLSGPEVARRLGLSHSGYAKLEQRADRGEISVATLRRAAEALECECFVTLRPRSHDSFADRLWMPLIQSVRTSPLIRRMEHVSPWRRILPLIAQTTQIFESARFRKAQGYSRFRGR